MNEERRIEAMHPVQTPTPGVEVRIVVGVNGSTSCDYALDLASRLRVGGCRRYEVVNVTESILPDGSFPVMRTAAPLRRAVEEQQFSGAEALRAASKCLAGDGTIVKERQEQGAPAEILMRAAREVKASLVIVGHNRRNPFDDFTLGSVARVLLRECPQDLLIARPPAHPFAEFNIVIATDDSPDSAKCIDAFLLLDPKGIYKVYVVTVNEITGGAAGIATLGLPHLKAKAAGWITKGLEHDGRLLAKRLEQAGFDATSVVVSGTDPAAAIIQVCEEKHSSLVVMAAGSHGFWDRLFNGSVSESIFADDSRSLLVLRT